LTCDAMRIRDLRIHATVFEGKVFPLEP